MQFATDHCPFTFAKQTAAGAKDFTQCPSGAPGVEERLPLMFSEAVKGEHLTIPQVVHYLCTNPAKIAGLYPKKGTIQTGSDADLVLIDPKKEWTITTEKMHGNADYTCYEGTKVTGCDREGISARKRDRYGWKLCGNTRRGPVFKTRKELFGRVI